MFVGLNKFILVLLGVLIISSFSVSAAFDPYENCSIDNSSYQVKQNFESGVNSPPTGWSNGGVALSDWSSSGLSKEGSRSAEANSVNGRGVYPTPTGSAYTVSTWAYTTTTTNTFILWDSTNDLLALLGSNDILMRINNVDYSSVTYNINEWYYYQYFVNTTSGKSRQMMWDSTGAIIDDSGEQSYGAAKLTNQFGDGGGASQSYWDDFRIWDDFACPPAAVPPTGSSNATAEQTVSIDNHNTVTVSSSSFVDVYTGSFTSNSTEAYSSFSVNILPQGGNSDAGCRILVDGVDYGTETNRTGTNGAYGLMYILSSNYTLSEGDHNISLQCRKTNSNNYAVTNSIGIVHLLKNANNQSIAADFFDLSVSTGDNLIHTSTVQYNLSNNNVTGKYLGVVVDGVLEYLYDTPTPSYFDIMVNVSLNGDSCGSYLRSGQNNDVGSGGFFCSIEDNQNISEINISFDVQSMDFALNSDDVNIVFGVKEFVMNKDSVVKLFLNETQVDSASMVEVATLQVNNSEFTSANLVVTSGFSAKSDSGAADTTWGIKINGVSSVDSRVNRDFGAADRNGLVVVQHIFKGIGQGIVNVSLEGLCDNAACSLAGGTLSAYLTDDSPFLQNSTNVTAFNTWDNASITSFNVTNGDGTVFSTNSSFVEVFSSSAVDDLVISAGGYFPVTVLNVTIGDDLDTGLFQSDVGFNVTEIITLNNLTGVNFTIDGRTRDNFKLSSGLHNVTATKSGYYNLTSEVNITPLFNGSFNMSGMFNSIINITVTRFLTGTPVTNFNISTDYGLNLQSTATGYLELPILQNISNREINVSSDVGNSFASINNFNVSSTVFLKNQTIYVFTFNSVLVNIYDADSLELLNTTNVTMATISSVDSWVNVTDTGFIYVDFLQPLDYELRFNATGYNSRSKFVTVLNDSTQNISIFMTTNGSTELQVIEVLDTANEVVEGAVVWLQKELIGASDQFITVQEAETDFNGRTTVWVIRDTSVFYRFAVVVNGSARPILPNEGLFTGKTSFIPSVTETVQIIVNLALEESDIIADRLSISSAMYFGGVNNNTVFFDWLDGRSTITGGKLVIKGRYLTNSSTYSNISVATKTGDFGSLNYTFIPINNTYYTIEGYVTFSSGREELVEISTKSFDIDVLVDKNTGLLYAVFVLMVISLITVKYRKSFGAAIGGVITIGSLFFLTLFGLISIPYSLITSLIAFIIIVFGRVKSRND